MATSQPCLTRDDYRIGIVCALPVEKAAMEEMLDAEHHKLNTIGDENFYTLGRIGVHNVVIACLPAGLMGIGPAAIVASNMRRSFPIIFGLMVGVGGGVWSKKVDMRLGDIVVGQPEGQHSGVVQWDFGKTETGGEFHRTGIQNKPPRVLLHALQTLKTRHWKEESKVTEHLSMMYEKRPHMAKKFGHQGVAHDRLFESTYDHEGHDSCENCDSLRILKRLPARPDTAPRIHYGNIASGNQVMKHGIKRDEIANKLGVICFEMEAAGLDDFPCLVIRGICDYADSHKNKRWQPYAAATAAAYAKELLGVIDEQEVATSQSGNVITSLLPRDQLIIDKISEPISQQDLLDRISLYDYERVHRRLCRKRLQGTGQWFLEHPEFKEWLDSKGSPSLWCSGIIGSGKTMIATAVIDAAKRNSADSGDTTIYFYCENEQRDMLRASDVFASFVRQLLTYLIRIHRPCSKALQQQIWRFFGTRYTQPDFDDLADIFMRLSNEITGITYVIDGLDELDEEEAKRVLLVVKKIFGGETKQNGSRIALFSRDQIASYLKVPRFVPGTIHISTSNNIVEDIELYIEIVMEQKSCVRELTSDPALLKDIKRKLLEGASGMIFWVHLQLEILWDTCFTSGEINKAIQNLPKDLEDTYHRCLQRIERGRQYTQKVLKWVSYATRPLHIDELREAVAFDVGDKAWDADKLPEDAASLIGCCSNLVVQDATDQCVRFAHPSVRQFLESNQSGNSQLYPADPKQGELSCGEFCVAYLSFADFGLQIERISDIRLPVTPLDFRATQPFSGVGAFMSKISRVITPSSDLPKNSIFIRVPVPPTTVANREQYKFLRYAVAHWATQTTAITRRSAVWNLFEQLAINPNKSWSIHPWKSSGQSQASHLHGLLGWAVKEQHKSLLEIVLASKYRNGPMNFFDAPVTGGNLPALHVASRLGFEDMVTLLLRVCEINKTDGEGYTAIHHAAEKGYFTIAKLLSDVKGIKVDTSSNDNLTPLSLAVINGYDQIVSLLIGKRARFKDKLFLAAQNGHFAVVKLLLEAKADVEMGPGFGQTPLFIAAENGHLEIVKLLLQAKSDTEVKDEIGETALLKAAKSGHEALVKLLLEASANIEVKDNGNRTALIWAVTNGHEAVVKLLLEAKTDVEMGHANRTPLFIAVEKGHLKVVKLLIEANANAEATNDIGETVLLEAAQIGHEAVVKLLLKAKANAEAKNPYGQTALLLATDNGHNDVVKLLLEAKVNTETRYDSGETALITAAKEGNEVIVKLLLEANANIEAKDNGNRTALLWAVTIGHEAIVKLLLEAKADVEMGYIDQTPLVIATEKEYLKVVKLLLEAKANTEAINKFGETSLLKAAKSGHDTLAKLLLEAKANIKAKNHYGQTALLLAADNGHNEVVKLLLEAKANPEAKDLNKRTALLWAAKNGHNAIVKLLLEANVKIDVKDKGCWTALLYAAKEKHEPVVKLLIEAEADTEAKDPNKRTALIWAAENGHDAVIKLLLEAGADTEAEDDFGETALLSASKNGFAGVAKLLLMAKADTEARDTFKRTALLWAAENGHEAVLKLLLEAKANIEARDFAGQRAIYCAARSGHGAIVNLLIEAKPI